MVNYEKFVRSHAGSSRVFMVMTDYEDSATAKAGLNGRTCVSLPGSKCSGCPFLGIVLPTWSEILHYVDDNALFGAAGFAP